MKPVVLLTILAAALALVVGCGGAEEATRADGAESDKTVQLGLSTRSTVPAAVPAPTGLAGGAQGPAGSPGPWGDLDIPQRMVVRTVSMSLLVDDVAGELGRIAALAQGVDGFVVSSHISGDEGQTQGYISIRVPAEETDAVLAQVRDLAVRVDSESTQSQDVTEEYVDLKARLANLERTEEQYLRLMDRADAVEDILKVQRELTDVRGQIEQLKGRTQYLERTSATSLISVELRPATSPEPLVRQGWSPVETMKEAVRALTSFGQGLASLLIRVGVFAPVWAPLLALSLWLVWYGPRLWRRWRRREG